mmetsp:Transcript_14016/g.30994  ORF Transcript_14016/g.30994 Transcript_14016/m.30994 type:complete len:242 (+) Transcript_14016:141-866(+)
MVLAMLGISQVEETVPMLQAWAGARALQLTKGIAVPGLSELLLWKVVMSTGHLALIAATLAFRISAAAEPATTIPAAVPPAPTKSEDPLQLGPVLETEGEGEAEVVDSTLAAASAPTAAVQGAAPLPAIRGAFPPEVCSHSPCLPKVPEMFLHGQALREIGLLAHLPALRERRPRFPDQAPLLGLLRDPPSLHERPRDSSRILLRIGVRPRPQRCHPPPLLAAPLAARDSPRPGRLKAGSL